LIAGVVNTHHEAVVRFRGRGPGGSELDVDAVIDSGFTASLTLPATTAAAFGQVILFHI
jgi:predicted aspartyl protease